MLFSHSVENFDTFQNLITLNFYCLCCRYIHNQKIIHRDLKLGNMLLNDTMHVKIADFGLATRVEYEGEKKM